MKLTIDTDAQTLTYEQDGAIRKGALYDREAFETLSELWLKVGWALKYSYAFTWMGRPIIQLPEDIVRMQEVIWQIKPDVIVETGVAHGGSLVFYAALCRMIGRGRVIGVDIEVRPENRAAIEAHPLSDSLTLVEGSSTSASVLSRIDTLVHGGETVLVILDSNHTKEHVAAELEAYHRFVSIGSYIVATDGIMKELYDAPGGTPDWRWNHPAAAAAEFAARHPEFTLAPPKRAFSENELERDVTYWPGAWLRRDR